MLIKGFAAGPWGTNCYVVAPAHGTECLVVDPGQGVGPQLSEIIRDCRLKPVAVLLTHGHIDHVWSVAPVGHDYGIPAYVHSADAYRVADPIGTTFSLARETLLGMTSGALDLTEPDDVRVLADRELLSLAGVSVQVRHAPGHTEGSVVFVSEDEHAPLMLSGDVLFEGSIGRTDLPGGDPEAMERSLREVILPCPDAMTVLPGHGAATTIGRERASNPFLRALGQGGTLRPPTRGV